MRAGIRSLMSVVPLVAMAAAATSNAVPAGAESAPVPPPGSARARVNCAAGQTVSGALDRLPPMPGPVVVTITGVCAERVVIRRDDVILQGAAPGAGLSSPATGEGDLVFVDGARRVTLYQLTLSVRPGGHDTPLEVQHGAQVHGGNLAMEAGAESALLVWDGTGAEIFDSQIKDTSASIPEVQVAGGYLELSGTTVENGGGTGVTLIRGGTLTAIESAIRGHHSIGLSVGHNSSADLIDTEVSGNQFGVSVFENGTLDLAGTSRVADNTLDGIVAASGAALSMGGGTVIENNRAGVNAAGGSHVLAANVTIRNNNGSGISLGDTSTLSPVGSPSITGNTQWGIFCAAPPAVPQVTGGFAAASVTGNGAGATNCATLGIVGFVP